MKQLSFIFATILASVSFAGEPTPATKLEIAHLFSHLQESGCQFDRNGTWYDSSEAVSHLNKKYQYLMGKGLISSSEDFIEGAASESSMSGRVYRVRCGSNPAVNSADWFRAELEKYRKGRHDAPNGHGPDAADPASISRASHLMIPTSKVIAQR